MDVIVGLFVFVVWFFCAMLAAAIANRRGRSAGGWFFLGILVGPLALLAVAVASPNADALTRADLAAGALRPCPACAEPIRAAARKCRYCGEAVAPAAGRGDSAGAR